MSNGYECTLSEATLRKAREELNEDPRNRMGAAETLIKWLQEQPHITANTDIATILVYLRAAKFSQLRARELIENILYMKTYECDWLTNVDSTPQVLEFIRTRYFIPLPKKDSDGRQIVILRIGSYDPSKVTKKALLQANLIMFFIMIADEESQVNGFVYFVDMTGFGLKHQRLWSADDLRKLVKIWQNAMPSRFKKVHFYNMNPIAEAFVQLISTFLSKKLKDRMILHGSNLESVYKVIPMELLPREYLPDDYSGPHAGSIDEITDALVAKFQDPIVRERVRIDSDPKYRVDLDKKPGKDVPAESFRKLNID